MHIYDYQLNDFKAIDKVKKPLEQWRNELSPDSFEVTRLEGTERAFSGELWDEKRKGLYRCVCCGTDLFLSVDKFDSGTGWPSFTKPVDDSNIESKQDKKLFMSRTEVHCAVCEAHLGHVFPDGPAPTRLRYCMNSAALKFQPE